MTEPVERTYTVDERVCYDGPFCQGAGTVTRVEDGGIEVTMDGGEAVAPHVVGGVMYTNWRYLRLIEDTIPAPQEAHSE
jgi:hypothetical protein